VISCYIAVNRFYIRPKIAFSSYWLLFKSLPIILEVKENMKNINSMWNKIIRNQTSMEHIMLNKFFQW